jgi:4-amino-4-deoxy-L-arabinose transferase-like glycosyltransferase
MALGDYLPLHDAARLATGVYLLILLLFTALIGRATWSSTDPGGGSVTVLVLIGTLALALHGHFLSTDVAMAAGLAMGLYGLTLAGQRWFWSGLWLGTGAGLAFMSTGLLAPAILLISALLLLVFGAWRSRISALIFALIAATPWVVGWPALLYVQDPALVDAWLAANDVGQFLGRFDLSIAGALDTWQFWLKTWFWLTFPAGVLALLTLVLRFPDFFRKAGVKSALVVSLVGWAAVVFSGSTRELDALALLAPLAVLGAGSAMRMPRLIIRPVYWLTALGFGVAAIALWGIWAYGIFQGTVPPVPYLDQYLPMDFKVELQPIAYGVAAVLTLIWVWIAFKFRPPRAAALLIWPAGIVMLWALVVTLHLPWLDAANSYRGVFTELRDALPAERECISSVNDQSLRLRPSEQVLAHYFAEVEVQEAETADEASCDLLLVEVQRRDHPGGYDPGASWQKLWEGKRPADERQLFMLFSRAGSAGSASAPGS